MREVNSLSLWERAGVRGEASEEPEKILFFFCRQTLTLTLSQRERENDQ